jgi:hypothetical protein
MVTSGQQPSQGEQGAAETEYRVAETGQTRTSPKRYQWERAKLVAGQTPRRCREGEISRAALEIAVFFVSIFLIAALRRSARLERVDETTVRETKATGGAGEQRGQREAIMRLFNREVFRGTLYTTEQFSAQELNGLLGSADSLAFHWTSNRAATGGGKVNINIYHSGDNQNWVLFSTLSSVTTIPTGQLLSEYLSENLTGGTTRGAFVRLGFFLDSGDSDLVVIATGRAL